MCVSILKGIMPADVGIVSESNMTHCILLSSMHRSTSPHTDFQGYLVSLMSPKRPITHWPLSDNLGNVGISSASAVYSLVLVSETTSSDPFKFS